MGTALNLGAHFISKIRQNIAHRECTCSDMLIRERTENRIKIIKSVFFLSS